MTDKAKAITSQEAATGAGTPIGLTKKSRATSLCHDCDGAGYKGKDIDGKRFLVPCECQREHKIRKQLPPLYHEAKLGDFSPSSVEQIKKWLARPNEGLFLCGPPGTGKTHLAAAVVRETIEVGRAAIFCRAYQFFQAIRDGYQQGFSEESVLREYISTPLLIIDDLGSGSLSDHERRFTLELLDRRINEMKATVVTTNWKLKQIKDLMDERLASRLSGFKYIEFSGRDRRQTL